MGLRIETKKRGTGKGRLRSLSETLALLHKDFTLLFEGKKRASDPLLMHRVALMIRQLHHDAKRLRYFPKYKEAAEHIVLTLTTPWGAPFVMEISLLDAAENLDEQNPASSDMHHWLSKIARYGHHFPQQILSIISA